MASMYTPATPSNPFGNVLLPEIADSPDRKPAMPSFNPFVADDIDAAIKQQAQKQYPTMPNAAEKLYGNRYDQFQLDQSLQRFYTMPSTQIANAQGALGQMLYGDMPSGKEDNALGAIARINRTERYPIY
jgi:hypothetical protein